MVLTGRSCIAQSQQTYLSKCSIDKLTRDSCKKISRLALDLVEGQGETRIQDTGTAQHVHNQEGVFSTCLGAGLCVEGVHGHPNSLVFLQDKKLQQS